MNTPKHHRNTPELRFDLLKIDDAGMHPICTDLSGNQAVCLLDELKQVGLFIVKFSRFQQSEQAA